MLFGGFDGQLDGSTWEWDGTTWVEVATEGPSPRIHAALAYDPDRAVTVLFGGFDGKQRNDTWEWDGTVWTERDPSAPPPPRPPLNVGVTSVRR